MEKFGRRNVEEEKLHCKKKVSDFPVPAKESVVSDIPARDGKSTNLFLQCKSGGVEGLYWKSSMLSLLSCWR
jgi:hypothetical protein